MTLHEVQRAAEAVEQQAAQSEVGFFSQPDLAAAAVRPFVHALILQFCRGGVICMVAG